VVKKRLEETRERYRVARAHWILVTLVVSLQAGIGWAGGFSISILGARRTGMLANLGSPDDLTALLHNPAGLADQRGWRFHVSGSSTFMDTEFRMQALDPVRFPAINPPGCGTGSEPPCPWPVDAEGYYTRSIEPERYYGVLPYVGLSSDLGGLPGLGRRGRDIVVSLAVTAPNLYGARLPAEAPTAYNFHKGFFAVVSTMVGAGWRVTDWLSVGANLSYNAMLLSYSQRLSLADTLRGENPTPEDERLADQAQSVLGDVMLEYEGRDHGVGWTLGVLLRPLWHMSVGLAYNGASSPRFSGPVKLTSTNLPSVDLHDVTAAYNIKLPRRLRVGMGIPHSVQAGLTFVPLKSGRLEVGLDYRLWLYNLLGRQTIEPVYDPNEPGTEPMTTDSLSREKDYRPSWALAVGALLRPLRTKPTLEIMAGFEFDKSPVPDKWFSLDNPSMNQIVVAAGVRWQATRRCRVAATYLFDYYMPRDVRDSGLSPPMNVQGRAFGHTPRLEIEGAF